jgi:hypothetical protein
LEDSNFVHMVYTFFKTSRAENEIAWNFVYSDLIYFTFDNCFESQFKVKKYWIRIFLSIIQVVKHLH